MAIVRIDGYPEARYDRKGTLNPQGPHLEQYGHTRTFDGYGLFAGLS